MSAVPGGRAVAVLLLALAATGCRSKPVAPSPVSEGYDPARTVDPVAQAEADDLLRLADLDRVGQLMKAQRRPAVLPPKRTILTLSGGGQFGAYTAGVICGWTEAGTRPPFDVVTGSSAGALAGCLAFAGPDYDPELKRFASTLAADEVFRQKRLIRGIRSDSLADSSPLAGQIAQVVSPAYIARVCQQHMAGRRFYVATTNLDAGRMTVWDMGEIACRGTPESVELYRKVLLASASIPGFFPPVNIPVTVNGRCLTERHVDGGVTATLFARPPWVPPGTPKDPNRLYDCDLYAIVAGKLYPDPAVVDPKVVKIVGSGVSTLTYAQARDELVKLYAATLLTGMNFHVAALPQDFCVGSAATAFDTRDMARMFEEGRRQSLTGTAWRTSPPGVEAGEETSVRGGTDLLAPQPPCRAK